MSTHTPATWGTRLGFILASAGSAVGLGAIWKFPYMAGTNGGSVFMLPYIFFTLTVGVALLLVAAEGWLEGVVSVSGLLAVVSMACLLKMKCAPFVAKRLSEKFGKLWLAAEVILFVLVGAAVDIRYMAGVGLAAIGMIFSALIFRAVGVCLCLVRTPLTEKERLYCVFAYLPKATVQAAIGSVPLAAGLPCGSIVLSVAVLGIVITAPLGALLMDAGAPKLLRKEEKA